MGIGGGVAEEEEVGTDAHYLTDARTVKRDLIEDTISIQAVVKRTRSVVNRTWSVVKRTRSVVK